LADDLIQGGETAYYRALIAQYDKGFSKWETRGKRIVKRYLDERPDGQANKAKYNILWSNVENLKPAIYAQTPKPEVERRFLDKDPVGRVAADALERCISYFLHVTPFGSVMRQTRNDYLLVGRGVTWVRYVPKMKQVPTGQLTDDMAPGDNEPLEVIDYEDVMADYVHWKDFGHNPARTWEEVFCVWRKVYMTREQMRDRKFAAWNEIPLDHTDKELKELSGDDGKKATVYEIWDKNKRKAYWIAKSWPKYLDERADPLGLDKFFPCSEPMYATLSNDSLVPVPDYAEYQDQADTLDDLTNRIWLMQKAVKAAGVYDASQKELGRLLTEGVENKLIPVESWAALNEKGGLANAVQMMPMEEVAKTLLILYETRDKVLADLYQITGLSDLIRGDTKASETATAQQIKSNFINLRLSEKQREMQRLARNTIEIMGNIIARHFTLDTIKKISGLRLFDDDAAKQTALAQSQSLPSPIGHNGGPPMSPAPSPHPLASPVTQAIGPQSANPVAPTSLAGIQMPPSSAESPPAPQMKPEIQEMLDLPTWQQVYALLQDNPDRSFRIGIETDSTVEADESQQQQQVTQFVQAIGGFLEQAEQAAGNPDMAVFLSEMLSWACRRFPISRDLQGAIDTLTEKMAKAAQNPPPPKPDPAMAKVQGDQQIAQADLQGKQQLAQQQMQMDAQTAAQKAQTDAAAEQAQGQRQLAIEQQKGQIQLQLEREKMALEDQRARHQMQMQMQADMAKAQLQARTQIEIAEIGAKATISAAQMSAAKEGSE
jgi:hypothetical protein